MGPRVRHVSVAFTGGCVGALVNSLVAWHLGSLEIPQQVGVALAPVWTKGFLYERLTWGGLWGLLFLLPIWRSGFWVGVFSRGILFSLAPTLFQLFYVFPEVSGSGILGWKLGRLTPLFVFFYNAIWGLVTALWIRIAGK